MAARRGGAASRAAAPQRGRSGAGAPPPDPETAARETCLRLLSVRPRTRAELETALRRRGIDEDVVSHVLDRYSDVGMIDDEAFAKAWVSSRHHGRGLARSALAGELRRKGVAPDTVGVALDDLDTETEEATARALVERRLRAERGALRRASGRTRDPSGPDDALTGGAPTDGAPTDGAPTDDADGHVAERIERQKAQAALVRRLVGMLARKGYPAALAYRVVKEALSTDPEAAAAAELLDVDCAECGEDFDRIRS